MDLSPFDLPRSIHRRRLVYRLNFEGVFELFLNYFVCTALMIFCVVIFYLHLFDRPPHRGLLWVCGLSASYLLLCHYLSGKLVRIKGRDEGINHDLILSVMQSQYPRYILDEGRYVTTFTQPARQILWQERVFIFLQETTISM